MFKYSILFLFFCFFLACAKEEAPGFNDRIWAESPAECWNGQAYHLGNGFFGVSFFGGVEREILSLSEASMWTGEPALGRWEAAGVNPGARGAVPVIREAVIDGDYKRADSLISADIFGSSELYGHFTSIGDLLLKFSDTEPACSDYLRELDLSGSLGRIRYTSGETDFRREYFCSYPDRVMAMRFTSDRPGSISFQISADPVQDSCGARVDGSRFTLKGYIDGNLRPFQVVAQVDQQGGTISAVGDTLILQGADEAVLYLTMATDYRMEYPGYRGESPGILTMQIIERAMEMGFDRLKERHKMDYQELYSRIRLDLPGDPATENLSTPERFRRLSMGGEDPGYVELAFNLGRYMIISSSRPGTLPANLQGVWNTFRVAPWAGNYQSNINLQEIYWSCGPAGLIECEEPYIDWIADLYHSGKEIARRVYGTGGWVSHTTGNIWGHAAPIGNHPWGMYPVGAAWHCQHLWDHYLFTGDTVYLREQAYPLLKEASRFWMENLVPFGEYLISVPTVSAEHGALLTEEGLDPSFHDFRSDRYVYSLPGVYQDIQMIDYLFTITGEAGKLLDNLNFTDSLRHYRERLLPMKVGKHGQLQEWYPDIDSPGCHHRHIAHLYAVCPGNQIHPTRNPELAHAARKSLDMRGDGRFPEQELASGGNWARAHRMWCWARLMDGDRSLKIMKEMLTEQGFENGLTFQHASYHWERPDLCRDGELFAHFQLDGSAALPGCVIEMLVQSHLGEVQLLPALPRAWPSGSISGIRARGGYVVDLAWEEGRLSEATIELPPGKEVPLIRLRTDLIEDGSDPRIQVTRRQRMEENEAALYNLHRARK